MAIYLNFFLLFNKTVYNNHKSSLEFFTSFFLTGQLTSQTNGVLQNPLISIQRLSRGEPTQPIRISHVQSHIHSKRFKQRRQAKRIGNYLFHLPFSLRQSLTISQKKQRDTL